MGAPASATRTAMAMAPAALATAALPGARGMAYLALNNLADNPGARKNRKRVGRGSGSGLGKTAGKGIKGQKARAGNKGLRAGFEGGQTPLHRILPKWGFTNARNKKDIKPINISVLQSYIDQGRLDVSKVITMKQLHDAGICGKVKDGVKLVGDGKLSQPIVIEVTRASKNAIKAVEEAGGLLVTAWYNRSNLKVLLKPHQFHPHLVPRRARPIDAKEMAYYLDYENRGYLSPEMQFKLRELGLNFLHIPYPFASVEDYETYTTQLAQSRALPHVPRPAPIESPFENPLAAKVPSSA
ncbi:39S ribosomal protein L15, mitochondrial [Hondaea fermentalgiana]|uniref:39S ribosomal protein L15, mitochondrial n=1 Tax=Hondaea fermentalgiana TaxID=2315210 RepID=A0A2R5GSF3_9STRA|nr:39S ribosomal protein L15, mitochondrial [Hondaea fermentalgiana]|eukprot:GBG31573.1 39S ribosomal protein L15, mitochondrial [Hondaea fermentalgiana]